MNDREVIKTLNDMKGVFGERGHSQYSLYAIDRAIAALEKQVPKKPMLMQMAEPEYMCECGTKYYWWGKEIPANYCKECGQKWDWSVEV